MNTDIYEIYSACRLCGVGAGYKMPIIQSIINVDEEEVELKRKISDCVQIEVYLHDRMPPLICELCVDKIQDFYEFRNMCLETNRRTRLRLGLPLHHSQSNSETECILGVTKPLNSDSDEGELLARRQNISRKLLPKSVKVKKEPDIKIKTENVSVHSERSTSPVEVVERRETRRQRASSPKYVTRQNITQEQSISDLQDIQIVKPPTRARPAPKSVRKRDSDRQKEPQKDMLQHELDNENALVLRRAKRTRQAMLEAATPPAPPALPALPAPPTPAKKSKMSTEPPKPEKILRPGPKSSKEVAKLTPAPKSAPKSKKLETPPAKSLRPEPQLASASKSRKAATSEPTPKPKTEVAHKPEPRFRTREISPAVQQKANKAESVSVTAPRGKKREDPGSASRKPSEAPPRAGKAPAPASVTFECDICQVKVKGRQRLLTHLKTHVPSFTPVELSCNACELWFHNHTMANLHHKNHSMGTPYTCTKCYDDFGTPADYELHFTRNQCLSTYEVPDVKCEECWNTFPTYKLLEDHKCPGEGGRPGGRCTVCKAFYTYLRSLTAHEIKCKSKRKTVPKAEAAEDGSSNADLLSTMLPMQVRIVRCDTLLTASDQGHYDVAGVSHRFGLDRWSTYPYFYSMGFNVKSEPSSTSFGNIMVAINDEIKQEYLNNEDSLVHWDSNNDDKSVPSPRSVDSLSTISLKHLFSPKYLGKATKKKRKVKSENAFESTLVDVDADMSNVFDSVSQASTNSDTYDSDSILNKNSEKNDFFESLKDNMISSIVGTEEAEVRLEGADNNEEVDRPENVTSRISNNEEIKQNNNHKNEDTNGNNDISGENTVRKCNESFNEVTDESLTRIDNISKPELLQKSSDKCEANEPTIGTTDITHYHSDNNLNSSPKNGHIVSNKLTYEDHSPSKVEDDVEKSRSELDNFNAKKIEEQTEKSITNNDGNELDLGTGSKLSEIKDPIEHSDANIFVSQISFETNDEINKADDKLDASLAAIEEKSYVDYDKTNTNDCSIKNKGIERGGSHAQNDLKKIESCAENNDFSLSNCEERNKGNDEIGVLNITDDNLITENELFGNENVQSVDKFNINILDDEDKLLMAELDEQIGDSREEQNTVISETDVRSNMNVENRNEIGENGEVFGEKCAIGKNSAVNDGNNSMTSLPNNGDTVSSYNYSNEVISNEGFSEAKVDTLNMLINKQDTRKSLDLDSISDEEFNFDI